MLKTADKILASMKNATFLVIPRNNAIGNIPVIIGLVYKTKPYELFNGEVEPIDVIRDMVTDGGGTLDIDF